MPTNNHGQSDVVSHTTNIWNKEYLTAAVFCLNTINNICSNSAGPKQHLSVERTGDNLKVFNFKLCCFVECNCIHTQAHTQARVGNSAQVHPVA